jgi:hypothetical protein
MAIQMFDERAREYHCYRRAVRAWLVLLIGLGATSACAPLPPSTISEPAQVDYDAKPTVRELEPELTITCYAGTSTLGTSEADLETAATCDPATVETCLGQSVMMVHRRVNPETSTIVENWVEGAKKSSNPKWTLALLFVTGDTFEVVTTMDSNPRPMDGSEHQEIEWEGTGELVGEPWRWTGYSSKEHRRPPIVDVVKVENDAEALTRTIEFAAPNGTVSLIQRDELRVFDCGEWEARSRATLSGRPPEI